MLIKLRFRFPEVVLGILLAVAVFAMGACFESLRRSPSDEKSTTAAQDSKKESSADAPKTQSLWVPVDSVGMYTLVLAVFTGLLVAVSGVQGYFLLRADKTARIAAVAAQKSAEAVPAIERSYVFMQVNYSNFLLRPVQLLNQRSSVHPLFVRFNFVNHGKNTGCYSRTPGRNEAIENSASL